MVITLSGPRFLTLDEVQCSILIDHEESEHPNKHSSNMNIFFAFGIDMGNLGRKQAPRLNMDALLRDWNRTLAANRYPVKFVRSYRHTGNFLLQASEEESIERVAGALTVLPLSPAFAVFQQEDFLVFLSSAHHALKQTPRVISGRRWTPGVVMDTNLKAGIPPVPPSDERVAFGEFAVPRIRIAWKGDVLSETGNKLDSAQREGGWGALSNRMKQIAGGMWTARSMSTVEGIVQAVRAFR
jgi:hypothetical protein